MSNQRRCAGQAIAVLTAVVLLMLGITSASAAPDPHQPALSAMAIAGTDLAPGAKVSRQGYKRDSDFVLYYERMFRKGASFQRTRLLGLEADVGLSSNPGAATNFVNGIEHALKSKKLRRQLVREIVGSAPPGVKVKFGRVGSVAVGAQAFIAPFSISIAGLIHLQFAIAAVRVDRVDQMLLVAGMPGAKLPRAKVTALLQLAAGHMTTGLTPTVVTAPTISGTTQSGQTLTATPGAWTNTPSSYAYQWVRCDSTGANCQPILEATTSTYLVTDADVGSTLRVEVAATNAVATSALAQSDPTTTVTAANP